MFFGQILEPGKKYEDEESQLALHLSMASVEPDQNDKSVVSVYVDYEGKQFLVCSLCPANMYQVPLDLTFIEGQTVSISTKGQKSVHLTGYYMPESEMDFSDDDFDDESGSELEEEDEVADSDDEKVTAKLEKRSAESPVKTSGPAAKKVKTEAAGSLKVAVVNGQARKPVPVTRADEDDEDDEDNEDDGSDVSSESDLNALLANIKQAKQNDAGSKKEAGDGDKMNVSAEDEDDDDFEDADDDDDDDDGDEDMDEEESDEEDLSAQQKQIKQKIQQKGAANQTGKQQPQQKAQNGQAVGKGGQQQQSGKPQHNQQQQSGGQNRGNKPNFQRGGGGNRGSPGNQNKFQSPGSGFRGQGSGNKRGGFGGGRGGGSGGRGGGAAGGTPFNKNKNKNFSPHHSKGKKF